MTNLFWWEAKTLPQEDIGKGPLCQRRQLAMLTFTVILLLGGGALFHTSAPWYSYIALLLCARLFTLDLRYLVLPDVYTAPLFLLGVSTQIADGNWQNALISVGSIIALLIVFLSAMHALTSGRSSIGGGDIKMIVAISAFAPLSSMPFLTLMACLFTMVLTPCIADKKAIPFGPGLCLALLTQICMPDIWMRFLS